MPILLVRHGHAGSRASWDGPDRDRPLSSKGRAQARSIATNLEKYCPVRLLSSPYVRCLETLAPLAAELGLEVEAVEELAEGRAYECLDLIRRLAGTDVALCTHGDVIPEVLLALVSEDGLDLGPYPREAKGSVWVLDSAGSRFISASYIDAPV